MHLGLLFCWGRDPVPEHVQSKAIGNRHRAYLDQANDLLYYCPFTEDRLR